MPSTIKSLSGLLILIFSAAIVKAQSFPDYSERTLVFKDTTFNSSIISPVTPSDGIIDPMQYFIGPGDNILVSIKGVIDQVYNITVNQEGYLVIPRAGIIDLKNTTLEEGKVKIKDLILSNYRNVDIHVSLASVKKIKVNVIGAIAKPVSVILSGNSRLFDVLSSAQGVNSNADLRNIKIIDRSNQIKNYDLISYLRLGDKSNNPYLCEGDIVKIEPVDNMVSILGSVKSPGIYEFTENESVYHLIDLAGGPLDNARTDTIEISGFDDNDYIISSKFFSLQYLKNNPVLLRKGDRVIIRKKPEYRIDRYITINGFVQYPGVYKIKKDQTSLYELMLNEAGGFLEKASLRDAYIIRNSGLDATDPEFERLKNIQRADMNDDEYDYLKSRSRQRKGKMIVDFERLFENKDMSENLILKEGDEIYIPEKVNYITLVGQVLNPGNILYKKGLNVEDYIELAGGFGWRAIEGDIRVIRSNTGEWLEADEVETLSPGDVIWVPEDPPAPRFWDIFQSSLTILGQVATVVAATVAVIISVR